MVDLLVHPASRPLVGSVPAPADKSIAHRALLFAALATGTSCLHGQLTAEDVLATKRALIEMGVVFDENPNECRIRGVGLFGLRAPSGPLSCHNSATSMRLLAGLLSAQEFDSILQGDASLSKRPMARVVEPLRRRGAHIEGHRSPTAGGEIVAPLRVTGLRDNEFLQALAFESALSSAQVKSAVLLSGLYAHGTTRFAEPHLSRDHTERRMQALGLPLRVIGPVCEFDPAGWSGEIPAHEFRLPGDFSSAAFLLAAATIVKASRVTVRDVGTNPTRTGFLDAARQMRSRLEVRWTCTSAGEPISDVLAGGSELSAADLGGEIVLRSLDEIPVLAVLAARASGTTRMVDARELRVKESDRLASVTQVLHAFGVECIERDDGLEIVGQDAPLRAAVVDSHGDHRVAMAASLLGLVADGVSTVRNAECIAASFPRFVGSLRALGAEISVRTV